MSDGRDSYVCVGGPLAGQRRFAPKSGFAVPISDEEVSVREDRDAPRGTVAYHDVRYVREEFNSEIGPISFWRPEGQTIAQSLELLLDTYQNAPRRRVT